jgi:hypothetical protein
MGMCVSDVSRANIETLFAQMLPGVRVVYVTDPIPQADRDATRFAVIFEVPHDPRH